MPVKKSASVFGGKLDRRQEKTATEKRRGERLRLQGDGSPADLALLEALSTMTGRGNGELISEGLRLFLKTLLPDDRKAVESLAEKLEARKRG